MISLIFIVVVLGSHLLATFLAARRRSGFITVSSFRQAGYMPPAELIRRLRVHGAVRREPELVLFAIPMLLIASFFVLAFVLLLLSSGK